MIKFSTVYVIRNGILGADSKIVKHGIHTEPFLNVGVMRHIYDGTQSYGVRRK